jgi:hypothetical protein
MSPEAYQGRADEQYGHNEDKSTDIQTDAVRATSADLVARIDRFLNEPSFSANIQVRKGTQSKILETLQVIEKALHDYGYSRLLYDLSYAVDSMH